MRLLFIHDGPVYYDENMRYYEYSYHNLLERYKYIAEEITFLMRTAPVENNTYGTLMPDEIKIVSVPNITTVKEYLRNRRHVGRIIKDEVENSDCLVLRGGFYSSIAYKYAVSHNKPFIYECVGCAWDALWNYDWRGKIIAPFSFLRERKRIRDAKYVYYVTTRFLQHRYPNKYHTVACSNVVIKRVNNTVLERRISMIKEYLTNNDRRLILGTAAAIDVPYKGQEYVIKAIDQLLKAGVDVEYHMAGGNRQNSTYLIDIARAAGVEDRVKFLGSLSTEQMNGYYDSIDIYIQPSKQEGLPRSLIEAMSRGCPALGTNVAGIPELLPEQFTFKKGSADAVFNAIITMLHSDMIKAAKENFLKGSEYQYDVLSERRRRFYDIFISENHLKGAFDE